MRHLTLIPLLVIALPATAQTTLFSEGFEGTPAFTLNTTDANSVANVSNTWLINSVFAGGDGVADCFGLPLDFSIPATAAQPAGITTPNGNYLHTASLVAVANGISCCSFGAGDGFCTDPDDVFARMSTDVSTLGQSDVSLKFWWLCQGGNQNYGEVWFSINGGTSWLQVTSPISQYRNQSNWVEQTVSIPEFGNQATLRFGFRFHNGTAIFGAADPGFGIDDVRIIAAAAVPNSITINTITGTEFCQGAAISISYTAVGTYASGNTFTAQLSDASGSFAAPVAIGSVVSTASGSISAIIPALTPVGSGYRVRVVSSTPATVGSANSVDLSVSAAPFAGADDQVSLCKNSGVYDLIDFLPDASTCGTWTGPFGAFSGQLNTATDLGGNYTYTTDCPGGCPQDAAVLTVSLINPANAGNDVDAALCANGTPVVLTSYVSGGEITGFFFYQGAPTTGQQLSAPGVYPMNYVVFASAPCTNDTASFVFTVNAPADAGTSTTATICVNDPAVQLFSLLGGTPQPGGTWTDPSGQAFSGTLAPATGVSGLYTYTVNGTAPCPNALSFVAVLIDPCSGFEEQQAHNALQWLGQQDGLHTIQLGASVRGFDLLDATGRIVSSLTGPFAPGRVLLDLSSVRSGSYLLRANDAPRNTLRLLHEAR